MTTQKGKKTRYMRELRIVIADILIKKPQKTKKMRTRGFSFTTHRDIDYNMNPRKFISEYFGKTNCKSTLIQEYNIIDTFESRTLGIAIKVKNTRRFSEKRGWKVLNVSSHKNCGSNEELPLTIFTVRK